MYDKKAGCFLKLDDSFSFELASSGSASFISVPLETSNNQYNLKPNHKLVNLANESINLNDFNALFYAWKQKLEQFKLLMQIKHNNFGYSCDMVTSLPASRLDYKKLTTNEKKLKPNHHRHKIKRLNEPLMKVTTHKELKITRIHLPAEFIQQHQSTESTCDTPQSINNNEQQQPINHDYSNYLEQHTSFDNLISAEDLSKLDESKMISSISADSLVNSTHLMPSSYFNMPVSPTIPTICHGFFSHEINVTHMLDPNSDELFCDTLHPDISIQI